MCGIIGVLSGSRNVVPHLIESLKLLEYRGYDSAGVAVLAEDGSIRRRRSPGKISALESLLNAKPVGGLAGLGHTRWATHGPPSEANAHPHANGQVALVHNGIIENFQELKSELTAQGHRFESQTDSEVVVHLVTAYLNRGLSPEQAVTASLRRLEGAFAIVFLFAGHPDLMIGARQGSPLAIGYGDGEMYFGSDGLAIGPLSDRITYLEEGDRAVLTKNTAVIYDRLGHEVSRPVTILAPNTRLALGKGGFRHYMLKEIHEQPQVLGDTLKALIDPENGRIKIPALPFKLEEAPRLTMVACGTSFYAAQIAKYWLESLARLPVDVDVASEFRYRESILEPGGAALFISQSGETADTLAALRHCRNKGQGIISIVNVLESTIARESDGVIRTMAGPEFGVASSKAFTAQLTVLAALTIWLGRRRETVSEARETELLRALLEVPALIAEIINRAATFQEVARNILASARDVLYLGRGAIFPIAMEGALKLKEISYIHAEGYAAGEIKHGPIALVDEEVPVIVVAPTNALFPKLASNLEEVGARGGKLIFLGDQKGRDKLRGDLAASLILPATEDFVAPIVYAVPVQLLAYYAAVAKGTDVDQPRNLAKSVTVE